MSTNSNTSSGIGFGGLLAVLFIGLKLTNYIDWSWWWVLSPLWMPAAVFCVALVALGLITLGVFIVEKVGEK